MRKHYLRSFFFQGLITFRKIFENYKKPQVEKKLKYKEVVLIGLKFSQVWEIFEQVFLGQSS